MKLGLGTCRLVLALSVAISHLWANMIHGPAAYAVWGFFVLSGYLMTYILCNKYSRDAEGIRDFAWNRFLRIYPAYWIACLFGAVTLLVLLPRGINPVALNPQFIYPSSAYDWIGNIALLPIFAPGGLLVPVSGALAVEVGIYVLMPLMAYSKRALWLGLILSAALNIKYGLTIDSFAIRYPSFLTSFMAFAVGSLVAHYFEQLSRIASPKLSVLVWLLHCTIWLKYDQWPWTYGLYTSVILSAWVLLSLAKARTGKLDQLLGDLSYPVYLLHTTVGAWFLLRMAPDRSFKFFCASIAVTILLSWLLLVVLANTTDRLKRKGS